MSSLSRELVFLILQFLDEEKFKETVHKLEQESGFYVNMKYFEDEVQNGNWDNVEKYLSGFTKVDDNQYSMKIFFEIRKQKYLEALDRHDRSKAVEILVKDLKAFASFSEELFKEITQLLILENFRENEQLSKYGDTKSARSIMLVELKKLIEANSLFQEKLQFPNLKYSRLRGLINQSLNWQHQLCKNPRPNPDIKTLFVGHSCGQPNGALAPNNPLLGAMPKAGSFPPLGAHGPFQFAPTPVPTPLAGWMSNPSAVTHSAVSSGPIGLNASTNPIAILKHMRTPSAARPSIEYASVDFDHVSKRARPLGISDEVNLPVNILPVSYPQNHNPATFSLEDLPKTVVQTLSQGSNPMSMDFHPIQQTILLVGTNIGDIALWDVGTRERLVLKNFKVRDLGTCFMPLQASLVKDSVVSVNRIIWSPDSSLFGTAYSRHIVQIYSYHGGDVIKQHLEIDAHVGGVNDIAFAHPNKQLSIITCRDDKTTRVWDATSGTKQYTFEGHEAPVYSVCPHHKENNQVYYSFYFLLLLLAVHLFNSSAGKIKAWLYANLGSRVDYNAPGNWCLIALMVPEGETFDVEWNESEGAVKRTYQGFRKRSSEVAQFDTTRNRFLVAGDKFMIKFWDMDSVNLLTTVDADGGLPASPRMRFNKEGTLLAVATHDNGIKILANGDELRLMRALENHSFDATRVGSETITKNGDVRNMVDVKPRVVDESIDKSNIWKLIEVSEPAQCRSLRLPNILRTSKISKLIYTNSGVAILALASNAILATTGIAPQLWQPPSGILMTNKIPDTNPEKAVHCFALSKNDSYVMSASGGKISLFNMMTFKTMTTFMSPPPAATFLAFHPQDNNIIVIGMEDSTIQIYNVRVDEVKSKLRGHSKRITGLAFSNVLNVLVSSGADAQFHQDQIHFLAVHESQIALYETTKLEFVKQWSPYLGSAPIAHATFSCDNQLIYASFLDATICIFSAANLSLRRRILPAAYFVSFSITVYPLVIAAHPSEPNQFAVGMTDGSVYVLEPLESEAKWGGNSPARMDQQVACLLEPLLEPLIQFNHRGDGNHRKHIG
ncbi:hypothetical protein ZIOFF_052502 [Zingiber officinale]|uniref:CTLH domain-containing protein n=1 Tax=Zingiber officinale TaxID=94328 RepID=A0A8J5G425_ZINOF|nr:hypothetical protein ZIOFF_052502 [Zingiber officinale]